MFAKHFLKIEKKIRELNIIPNLNKIKKKVWKGKKKGGEKGYIGMDIHNIKHICLIYSFHLKENK